MEASHKKHRPHIKVGKDAEEEEVHLVSVRNILSLKSNAENGNIHIDSIVPRRLAYVITSQMLFFFNFKRTLGFCWLQQFMTRDTFRTHWSRQSAEEREREILAFQIRAYMRLLHTHTQNTHTHTLTHTHAHAHTRTCTNPHIDLYTHIHTRRLHRHERTHARTHTHIPTHKQKHNHTDGHADAQTRTPSRTHARTHAIICMLC